MNQEYYRGIEQNSDLTSYQFISEGRHGKLVKVVSFSEIADNIYNLALGTGVSDGSVDYDTITNNGDRNKLLYTVAKIIGLFFESHETAAVYITGSDERRTVLYQRAIAYGFQELNSTLEIFGEIDDSNASNRFQPFSVSKNYVGFLVKKRIVNAQ